jgi:hypothetical protein
MAYLDVGFQNGNSDLLWKANLAVAWNSARQRFKEIENLPYRGEWVLRCELTVFGDVTEFPQSMVSAKADEMSSVEVSKGKLTLLVPAYLDKLLWFPKLNKAGCCTTTELTKIGYPRFSVVALATFQPPRHMYVPDVRVWDTIGPSAGLPSLGKRR